MPEPIYPKLTFALDVADKVIKFAAVFIGAIWTAWNFRKSRTYKQKLELEVVGTVFVRQDLHIDTKLASRISVNPRIPSSRKVPPAS
jgi:hypothetical protein